MIIKKNNFRKILVAFCIGTFLCTGCHNKQNITQLESYDGKEQVSEAKEESRREYKYLAKTTEKMKMQRFVYLYHQNQKGWQPHNLKLHYTELQLIMNS